MTQALFRKEALEARRTSWLGGISLAQPIRLWVLTVFAAFAALVVICFLVFGTYNRYWLVLNVLPGDGTLEAELLVPSRAIGFIEPGDSGPLRYQACPYQKFGHHPRRVARISSSTVNPSASAESDTATVESFYPISVALDRQTITAYGLPELLQPGIGLDVDVLGEKRTLIEWVLEPIYSIQGTVFDR